ncbi:MAG: hypothetical protein ACE5HS_03965 [bacterium]
MQLNLSLNEHRVLLPILKSRIADYYMEIRRAMISPYKAELKRKKKHLSAIERMLEKLPQTDISIELTQEQLDSLEDCIQVTLKEKASEIWHTDSARWRKNLINEKRQLNHILAIVER